MTRAELVQALATALDGVPVAASPVDAVIAPAVVVVEAAPYRVRRTGCGWGTTWEVTAIGGRLDDVAPHDALAGLADQVCAVKVDGIINEGAAGAPTEQTIGDVDYLVAVFTFADYA